MKSGSGSGDVAGTNGGYSSAQKAYIVVGVAAAAVSAATAAYVFWSRQRASAASLASPQAAESVQQLLDQCHHQVRSIEQRLAELSAAPSGASSSASA